MNWNKLNRWIHREFGYFFFGMTVIYGISGIALNHNVAHRWNPSVVTRSSELQTEAPLNREKINKEWINALLAKEEIENPVKQYYFPDNENLIIYLKDGHISLNLETGKGSLTTIRNRPVFREMSFLHYNKSKKLWLWFSDLYAGSLVLLAITGLFLVKGKKGLRGTGGILMVAGILVPLIFLALYLWF
ncbi:MAG: PepSY-associated TM helix domain-containing protein [Bacteroidota bacterium]